MNWSQIPIIGWLIGLIFACFMAIPYYYLHNYLVPKYFLEWCPEILVNLPFWDIVWIFLFLSILKNILFKGIISVSNDNTNSK